MDEAAVIVGPKEVEDIVGFTVVLVAEVSINADLLVVSITLGAVLAVDLASRIVSVMSVARRVVVGLIVPAFGVVVIVAFCSVVLMPAAVVALVSVVSGNTVVVKDAISAKVKEIIGKAQTFRKEKDSFYFGHSEEYL